MSEEILRFASFNHKGLEQLYRLDRKRGVPPQLVDKLLKLLLAIETADSLQQLTRFPGWRLHQLKGNLGGMLRLTVSGNWRLIFRYHPHTNSGSGVDLIDYY